MVNWEVGLYVIGSELNMQLYLKIDFLIWICLFLFLYFHILAWSYQTTFHNKEFGSTLFCTMALCLNSQEGKGAKYEKEQEQEEEEELDRSVLLDT